jgi:hypothetical protein
VQIAGLLLVVGGIVILVRTRSRWIEWLRTHHAGDPIAVPPAERAEGEATALQDAPQGA